MISLRSLSSLMQFCKLDGICQNILIDGWLAFLGIELNKWAILFLLEMSTNHFKKESVFSHLLKWNSEISFLSIFSMFFWCFIFLMNSAKFIFAELINQHYESCRKSVLWSLRNIENWIFSNWENCQLSKVIAYVVLLKKLVGMATFTEDLKSVLEEFFPV